MQRRIRPKSYSISLSNSLRASSFTPVVIVWIPYVLTVLIQILVTGDENVLFSAEQVRLQSWRSHGSSDGNLSDILHRASLHAFQSLLHHYLQQRLFLKYQIQKLYSELLNFSKSIFPSEGFC